MSRARAVLGVTFLTTGALHFLRPMAVHAERFKQFPEPLLWARLPLPGVLIAWAWLTAAR